MFWRDMAEASTLRKKLHHLCNCLDPVVLSTALYGAEIVDSRIWEEAREAGCPSYDRCLKIMQVVLRKTKACPSVFDDFCKILEEDSITEKTGTDLRGMY